jgi:hypothetical protein
MGQGSAGAQGPQGPPGPDVEKVGAKGPQGPEGYTGAGGTVSCVDSQADGCSRVLCAIQSTNNLNLNLCISSKACDMFGGKNNGNC